MFSWCSTVLGSAGRAGSDCCMWDEGRGSGCESMNILMVVLLNLMTATNLQFAIASS